MPVDNIIHYILYAGILVGFFIVLKSPKKRGNDQTISHDQERAEKKKEER
jgi:uncharacterized protein YneF (UPF0154 family)